MVFKPVYILILAGTIIVDYFAGIYLEKIEQPKLRKWFLIASLIANIGVLAVFKYYNFLHQNLTAALGIFHISNKLPLLDMLLPIGLSFHTFQAMSYTFEVYNGRQKAEKNFGLYALYVMYYPQLVAGPIERPQNILHQLKQQVVFNQQQIIQGLKWMLWGMFVKIVIADRLAIYVDTVFTAPQHHSGITSLLATIFFTFQIYGDFSGYSLIAIGCAKVLGVDLMTNFKRPYLATSIRDFWSRWHISLSTWFRDYLYIPLGGNRVNIWRNMFNLFVVFLVSGLWHGANWTFIVWGALHGTYLMLEILVSKFLPQIQLPKFIRWAVNFVLVTLAWVYFRAASMHDAQIILSNILSAKPGSLYIGNASFLIYGIAMILFLMIADWNTEKKQNKYSWIYHPHPIVRMMGYVSLIMLMLWIGVFNGGQFIYFQF